MLQVFYCDKCLRINLRLAQNIDSRVSTIIDVYLQQAEALDLDKTVLQTVEQSAEDWTVNNIKALLGRCNFQG